MAPSDIAIEFQPMPLAESSTDPSSRWQGLSDLRESLISQDRIMEALRLGTLERSLSTKLEDRFQNLKLFFDQIIERRGRAQEEENQVYWYAATLRLHIDLVNLFISCNMQTQAKERVLVLEEALEETIALVNAGSGNLMSSDAMGTLSVEFCRLKLLDESERTEVHFRQLVNLSERMMMGTHIETEQCQNLAISWAKQLFPDSDQAVIGIQFRTQHLFESVQGRVPDAAANLCEILTPTMQSINEAARSIQTLDLFEKNNPPIANPLTRGMLDTLRSGLLLQRGGLTSKDRQNPDSNVASTNTHNGFPKLQGIIHEQNLLFDYFSRPEKLRVVDFLRNLVREDAASGLSPGALDEIFALNEDSRLMSRAEFLELNGHEMLQRLVGCTDSPVRGERWLKRRSALQSWLLSDGDQSKLPVRHCVWVEIHNARILVWREHCRSRMWTTTKAKARKHTGRAAPSDGLIPGTDFPAHLFFSNTQQLSTAIEERIGLNEARLGYQYDHYERETQLWMASLPQLYMQLFFSSYIRVGVPNDSSISHLSRAGDLAREQLIYWKASKNSLYTAMQAINIATVAQYKIECGIIEEVTISHETVVEALLLLDEVETLFGSTLRDVDLEHSLSTLQIKVHMGSKMDIWTASSIAIRILLTVIKVDSERDDNSYNGASADRQCLIMTLWHWVQRSKARALAHSMGLDNPEVQSGLLMRIQESIAKRPSVKANGAATEDKSRKLQLLASLPLHLLQEICEYLTDSNISIPDLPIQSPAGSLLIHTQTNTAGTTISDVISFAQDLHRAGLNAPNIRSSDDTSNEIEANLTDHLSVVNRIIAMRPELHAVLRIASLLNEESKLLDDIQSEKAPITFQSRFRDRIDLQALRQEMNKEPLLHELLRVREGRPLHHDDLHEIALGRDGKIVFVDWFTNMSLLGAEEDIHMVLWRDGTFELVDLGTTLSEAQKSIRPLVENRGKFLASLKVTPEEKMDKENMVPINKFSKTAEFRPIKNGQKLVKPLFRREFVEPGDLLVLSVTEGFDDYPLHAIELDGRSLIDDHPVVYVPSLSVLHRCYLSRNNRTQSLSSAVAHKARFLGGVETPGSGYQYGVEGIKRLESLLNIECKTFTGPKATVDNFRRNIGEVDLLHVHLHSSYNIEIKSRDTSFTSSPLSQALHFAGKQPLSAQEILHLPLAKGAHLNLAACASGQQGRLEHGSSHLVGRTNEVMGLVPAFLFAGAGSVTGTLWAVMDEHAVVFAGLFWKAIGAYFAKDGGAEKHNLGEAESEERWIDLADIMREVVLEMKEMYLFPSAWAGFVLNGYWRFQI